jgi:eukaryotic-like serine/threonine-protein kinase
VHEPCATPQAIWGGAGPLGRLPEVLRATAVYRPRRHHDQGGLGVVYTAHQEELDRTVALKRIRPDRLHDPARRRFLREAALTARLQHPGIVPIYDLGQDEAGPFYTMPFIQGRTLQEAIDAFHGEQAPGRDPGGRGLRLRELLQHLIAACNTVAYAHDQGVVHRDLKPSNIMLGPYGETLVLDWGLAKRFGPGEAAGEADGDPPSPGPSPEAVTATGEVLGTPQYMSPEQARGEPVGPAGDIFNLGLVLYAILTGKTAFEESSFRGADRLQAVREAAIVPPRARDPGLPRALEAICLKALAARAVDRYPSARALGEDVTRWLADEPVTAWREPTSARTLRWMRRHRALVISTAAVLVLGVVGLAGFATVLAGKNAELVERGRALNLTNTELAGKNRELDRQRRRAEEREALAISAMNKFRDAVSANAELKNRPELDALRKALLKEPREFFRTLRDQLQADRDTRPEALARLAAANSNLARTTAEIGSAPDALESYAESRAILERLARDHPAVAQYWSDLAGSYNNTGILLRATGRVTEALESFRRALEIRERLVRDDPAVADYQRNLAVSHHNLADLQHQAGLPGEALESHRKAMAIEERLERDHPTLAQYRADLARSYEHIGGLLSDTGHPAEAMDSYREALAIRERLVRDHGDVAQYQHELAFSHHNLGYHLNVMGQPTEALRSYRRALEILERLVRDHPTVTEYRSDLAQAHNSIGIGLVTTGHPAEALDSYRKAAEIREQLVRDHPTLSRYQSDLARSYNNIAGVLSDTGHPAEALEPYRLALEIGERLTRDHPSVHNYRNGLGVTLDNLAEAEMLLGRWREARERLQRAIEHQRVALAAMPRHPFYRKAMKHHLINLAKVHRALNQPAEAIGTTQELAAMAPGDPSDDYNVACTLALCVPLTRGEQRRALATKAVRALKQAIDDGWNDAGKTVRDPDLAPLRDCDDFRQVVAELFDRGFPAEPLAR